MRFLFRMIWASLLAGAAALSALAHAQSGIRPNAQHSAPCRFVVLYAGDAQSSVSRLHAIFAANLAGHVGRACLEPFGSYRTGDLGRFEAAIIVGAGDTSPPDQLIRDLAPDQKVLWLGGSMQLPGRTFDPGFTTNGATARPAAVIYKGVSLTRETRGDPLQVVHITDPARARVLATAEAQPWAVRSGGLTYVAEDPLGFTSETDRYLAVADLFLDLLDPQTPARRTALVRIEDVGPEADPVRLRRIVDVLADQHIPFSVAVYDSYRDPGGRFSHGRPVSFSLRSRPALTDALAYAVEHGGTLVMHGHTHQSDARANPYARVSGGDYEFFAAGLGPGGDFLLQGPLPDDTPRAWGARLDAALATWADVGLPRPSIFTTPHYAASASAYAALRERFPARYERTIYFANEAPSSGGLRAAAGPAWAGQFFPYEVRDIRGDAIIPENLGYYAPAAPGSGRGSDPDRLVDAARRNLVVRDAYASFFFHWFEDPAVLGSTVRRISSLGYSFASPGAVLQSGQTDVRGAYVTPPQVQAPRVWVWIYRFIRPTQLILLLLIGGFGGLLLDLASQRIEDQRSRDQRAATAV